MRWLDNLIDRSLNLRDQKLKELINSKAEELKNSQGKLRFDLDRYKLNIQIEMKNLVGLINEQTDKLTALNKEVLRVEGEFGVNLQKTSIKIDEKERQVREDLERSITTVIRMFDSRLEGLGDKRAIVTDLLKKIAKLE